MSQPCRWVSRIARRAVALGTVVLFGAGALAAQGTTGKVEGTVRDQAGAPVAGAQVLIVGSAFAGVTNEQGYYFINNVPAGLVTLRAQYIGYAPAEVRGVRVLAGQTFTQPLTLSQQAVTVEGITVEVAANPLVPRDQVATKSIVQGDLIDDLPVDNLSEIGRLQPGVIESNRGLVIRGGRPRESATYIDGVLVRNMNAQFVSLGATQMEVAIGTNAVEEASITTGAIGAEYGDAQSGVINLVTRSGGTSYSGSLAYSTDEVSGQTYGTGLHRVEASFGGPLARNLTFFLSTTLQGQQNGRRGKGAEDQPVYVLNGLDTSDSLAPNGWVNVPTDPDNPLSDSTRVNLPAFARFSEGSRFPGSQSDNLTFTSKLTYSYGTGSRMAVSFHRSRAQGVGFTFYNPQAQRGSRQSSDLAVLNWTQNLSRQAERALTLEANLSWQRDEFISGLLDPQWFADNRDPFANFSIGSLQFLTDFDNFPVDDQLVTNVRINNCEASTGGRCIPFLGRRTEFAAGGSYRFNPYGVTAGPSYFSNQGYGTGGPTLSSESRISGRVGLDWQANRYNRVKLGGDFTSADMRAFGSDLVSQIFMDAYHEQPNRMGVFGQDRLDLGDLVIDLGLRYDRLNSGVMYPRVPGRVFSDPLRDGDLAAALTAEDTLVANRCNDLKVAGDTVGWSTCNFVAAPAHTALAPSVRVSFPVTDRTGFRLSYAHQTQSPDFSLLVGGVNADLNYTNTNDIFGRDLTFGRSIVFEFGVRHAFSDDMVLDVSAYNKDKVSDVANHVINVYDNAQRIIAAINMPLNADFGNTRGIEVTIDRRVGRIFQGRVGYTYQSARGTGSDPFEYLNTLARQVSSLTGDRTPPPRTFLSTRDDRTHTIAGTANLNFPGDWRSGTTLGTLLGNTGFTMTYRFASGLPYTRLVNIGVGQLGPGTNFGLGGTAREQLNSSRMPWIKDVSLRVTRGLRLGGSDLTVFADFRNLFNFTNLDALFAETGDVANREHRNRAVNPVLAALEQDAGNLLSTENGVDGYNLRDCGGYAYGSSGDRGLPDCLALRGVDRRFGNGDSFLTLDEIESSYNAWYDLFNGPYTKRGAGFNFRLGFELNF
jgi:hypothetical protein